MEIAIDSLEENSYKIHGKIMAAVSEEDFQYIKKEILNTLKGEKDYICSCTYSTLTEATNKIYSMLTEILVQEEFKSLTTISR